MFNHEPKEEREGISLDTQKAWEITSVKDPCVFLKNILLVIPSGSILYLEGVEENKIKDYLIDHPASNTTKVAIATSWPRPDIYHMEITEENIKGLINLIDQHSVAYICDHIHAYHEDKVFIQWHDAFTNDPILISKDIVEEKVNNFCKALGSSYKIIENSR